jgi:hypothetical protein
VHSDNEMHYSESDESAHVSSESEATDDVESVASLIADNVTSISGDIRMEIDEILEPASEEDDVAGSIISIFSEADIKDEELDMPEEKVVTKEEIDAFLVGPEYSQVLKLIKAALEKSLPPITHVTVASRSETAAPESVQKGRPPKSAHKPKAYVKESSTSLPGQNTQLLRKDTGLYPAIAAGRIVCPLLGCGKSFLNPGGLKYHMDKTFHELMPFYSLVYPSAGSTVPTAASGSQGTEGNGDEMAIDPLPTSSSQVDALSSLLQNFPDYGCKYVNLDIPIRIPKTKAPCYFSFGHTGVSIDIPSTSGAKTNRKKKVSNVPNTELLPLKSHLGPKPASKNLSNSTPVDMADFDIISETYLNLRLAMQQLTCPVKPDLTCQLAKTSQNHYPNSVQLQSKQSTIVYLSTHPYLSVHLNGVRALLMPMVL